MSEKYQQLLDELCLYLKERRYSSKTITSNYLPYWKKFLKTDSEKENMTDAILKFYKKLDDDFKTEKITHSTLVNSRRPIKVLEAYINGQETAIGFSYVTNEYRLKQFDEFCFTHFPSEYQLTKSLAMEWLKRRTNESESNLSKRMETLRQLGKYMNSQGTMAFIIPTSYQPKVPRYQPHIFTNKELKAFFNAVDACKIEKSFPVRHLVYPVLFRPIYCCGLRLSEASSLLRKDVETVSGNVYIINSKNRKDRLIVMSEDMSALCHRYDCLMNQIYSDRIWFFPSNEENHYCKSSIDYAFRYFWNFTSISCSGNQPRVHDLRHQYCITRINTWLREGKEIQSLLLVSIYSIIL